MQNGGLRNNELISYQSRNDGLIPQLFTSVPALNEAASYLAETTSFLSRCFTDYSGTLLAYSISIVLLFAIIFLTLPSLFWWDFDIQI